jgi:molybdate transport system substrate-binding protein
MPRRFSAGVALLASATAFAIGSVAPEAARAGEVLAAAAVSLRKPLAGIATSFETKHPSTRVLLSFGASSILAAQARAGAPIDVFVSADPRLVDGLERLRWVAARSDLARNALVVVAASGVPLARAEDLLAPRIARIAVPSAAVPLGGYARSWLSRRGLLERLAGRIVQTEHARATLAAVDAGHADAAIVYVTDAAATRAARTRLEIAPAEQPAIFYTAALRVGADSGARELFEFLQSDTARAQLAAAGFGSL